MAEPLMSRRRQQTGSEISERSLDVPGVLAPARCEGMVWNTGDPPRRAWRRARDRAYKGETEVARSREGVRGAHSTDEAGESRAEGRGSAVVKREWRYVRGHG